MAAEAVSANNYVTVIALPVIALGIGVACLLRRRMHLRVYGDAWRRFNAGAFREIVEPSPDERYCFVTRLAAELTTSKGQCGVSMRSDGGWAIHHVNKNGTFSKRGPYYVSSYRGTWRATGRNLLVKTVRGNKAWGFRPDHYKQNGIIYEKGVAVLEYATHRYAPVSLGDFVAMQNAQPLAWNDPPKG
jgi:hypothetical protein